MMNLKGVGSNLQCNLAWLSVTHCIVQFCFDRLERHSIQNGLMLTTCKKVVLYSNELNPMCVCLGGLF